MSQATDITKNTIKRDGISQRQRRVAALDPSSIKIDERTLEDFLVFAQEFAKQVHFYNLSEQVDGDWQVFWNSDPTMVIAAIEKSNPLPLKQTYEQLLGRVPSENGLYELIQILLKIARQIDFWYVNLQERSKFKTELKRLIEANFKTLLSLLAGYEQGAKDLFEKYPEPSVANYEGFAGVWDFSASNWQDIEANSSLFLPIVEIGSLTAFACVNEVSLADRLKAAYARLTPLLTSTYNVYFHIIQISPAYFQDSLTRKDHPPHLTLFITFLMLYQQVQADLNGLTAKHLDFYYKDVLGLKTKEAVPDKVHLFFELAKNIPEHELLAQIRFKAGKDDSGKNLFYNLDNNAVLNTAKVESLRTVLLDFEEGSRKVKNIHAAPMANSLDGFGTPIKDKENPSWATLGSKQMPTAALGFALASQELLLSEGIRVITIKIHTTTAPPPNLPDRVFDVFLSGKKEWIKEPQVKVTVDSHSTHIEIKVTLEADAPAVLPFQPKEFKEDLGTTLPVLKLLLHQPTGTGTNTQYFYELLRRLKIEKIELSVDVQNLQQVTAFNDEGAVDTTKPFMPFGANPKVGSSFYVGNAEAFQKSVDSVTLNLEWDGVPQNFSRHYAGYEITAASDGWPQIKPEDFGIKCYIQKNGTPHPVPTTSTLLGTLENSGSDPNAVVNPNPKNDITLVNDQLAHAFPTNEIAGYGLETKDGFIKIDLQKDFEHDQFQSVLTRQMLAAAKTSVQNGAYYLVKNSEQVRVVEKAPLSSGATNEEVIIPQAPYTPVLKSLKLGYISNSTTDTNADALTFLHLHPFPNAYQQFTRVKGTFLLPQFTTNQQDSEDQEEVLTLNSSFQDGILFANKKSTLKVVIPKIKLPVLPPPTTTLEQGSLFIGLSQLQPLQNLLLLFQVAENSANAELDKAKLCWHYLANNTWHNFKKYQIASDTTDELTTSGIVELSIPADINKNNTILPSELHWLKVSVTRNAGAVSQLINVHTQAIRATFQDNENDPAHFATPLAAETISKLEAADSALKSINQPYQSFGGIPAEASLSFYTRVSERLRHKGRAITLFDYERLILDAFPSVYKVKCINHTDDLYQIHPGHVLISVVPDFTKLKAIDRFQPKITLAKLEEIKRYLEERNTAFVCSADTSLHVLNPDYQKITLEFEVKFKPGISAIDFHVRKLREAIIRFLSPWAYENGAEINFGGKMYKSSILNFVEEQSYVDYVAHFKMRRLNSTEDLNEIEADTPRSILVPAAGEDKIIIHPILIDGYSPVENLQQGKTLGYLTLEETKINS